MDFTGERMVLGATDIELEIEHLNRYYFAEQLVSGKVVLDAACGTGYGSAIMAKNAKSVVGIDISQEAVDYANETYSDDKVEFVKGSVDDMPFKDNIFDIIVSFETIEHISAPQQNLFLKEIKRILKEDGMLLISSPNHSVYKKRGENHFHVKELNYFEFRLLLESKFKNVVFFSQQFEICNSILKESASIGEVNKVKEIEDAEYLIAFCSNAELPNVKSRVFVRNDNKLEKVMNWAVETDKLNSQKDKHIKKLDEEVETLNEKLNMELAEKDLQRSKNYELEEKINEAAEYYEINERHLNSCLSNLNKQLDSKIEQIKNLEEEIKNKEGHINQLLEVDREFTNIKGSRAWKMMNIMWRMSSTVIPHGSKRRLAVKVGYKFIRQPRAFLRKLSPDRIKKFFYYLRKEGVSGVSRRLDESVRGTKIRPQQITVNEIAKVERKFEEYNPINVPVFENPAVSIVIPVYNQFEFTYNCIKSIVENSGNISYEIIIANDCSTDLTTRMEELISGITVIANEKNLRFLLNCNHAAQYAKGKYILFLNNDTQVQKNWLAPLVELIERDEKIGMVGSKLVYPDGRLQEAGGILWKDGSAWNYGHLSDPNDPEYNYVKEVDYISGAAIMIRSVLWKEIGGFDERFVPAYYEDTDLAFEVRKHGYKVMYQPLSVVVHFEGVSNGTDTSVGQKKYQIVNAKKFYDKWKDVLEKEHEANGVNVFKAKDRSLLKKHVLVVDHYVPHYDQDAGGKCTWMYMELFVKLGLKVTFIGDNFYKHEPYATELTQKGVEFLYGDYYLNNWKSWLEKNGNSFDYAYLNRPHISEKYIDIIKKYSACKIIYFGHDLHYLREYRQYEIEKDSALLKSSKEWKRKEFALFKKADTIYVVGSYEQSILKEEFPDKPVRNIPVYMYDGAKKDINRDFDKRNNIIFVGGFGHPPNSDAVLWFAENIFPKILEEHPDIKWYIVGSKPTEDILKLRSKNIVVTGFVSDEKLSTLYSECRMAVVPLRIGAGVKGKVIEAVYNGIPLVTTPIGAEGLSCQEGAFVVCDCNDGMAEIINNLYDDFDKLRELSFNCDKFINNYFTVDVAKNVVLLDFDCNKKRKLNNE